MLDCWIIEEMRKREQPELDRPVLEIPIVEQHPPDSYPAGREDWPGRGDSEKEERGVYIIDLGL